MAKANAIAGPTRLIYPERHVTIHQSWRRSECVTERGRPQYLWFKVAGVWLEDAGFKDRQRLKIEVEDERLVITPMRDDPPNDELTCNVTAIPTRKKIAPQPKLRRHAGGVTG